MFRKRLVVTLVAGIAAVAVPAFSQSETPRQEISAQAFGSFVTSTTQNGIENKATNSGGVLGSYRFFFSEHHGIEANYGYSLNTQSYGSPEGVLGVKTYSHEVSGAYVFRIPLRKVTPFALGRCRRTDLRPQGFHRAPARKPALPSSMVQERISTCRAASSFGLSIAAWSTIRRHTIWPPSQASTVLHIGPSRPLGSATVSNGANGRLMVGSQLSAIGDQQHQSRMADSSFDRSSFDLFITCRTIGGSPTGHVRRNRSEGAINLRSN